MMRCNECGDRKRLGSDGRCRWRAGCEHRQMQHTATMERLTAEMARLDRAPTFLHPAVEHLFGRGLGGAFLPADPTDARGLYWTPDEEDED